ncbi:hypothetical protein HMPREF0293_0486 [Corynebacterium glucuronolyticum ATCC 51866]|uniref:Uncharacterized protein n=1 Tax=Corynebacterium glucuronolyticum ATCC 51866 TaxID=548478 RepID=A0ABP2DYF5_9CORY|nr:hypothetical protein HMPREF0293_0486 [Corynebacterium glucuronolyticum ATCC 51866]
MRGEEMVGPNVGVRSVEIPPHARRRVDSFTILPLNNGNTSACAEKSPTFALRGYRGRKYLRMRGEETNWIAPSS